MLNIVSKHPSFGAYSPMKHKSRILIGINKVQPIEILEVVNNLFETMIQVNLKGRLMNFNETEMRNNINPVVIIASYTSKANKQQQMNEALFSIEWKILLFLLLF